MQRSKPDKLQIFELKLKNIDYGYWREFILKSDRLDIVVCRNFVRFERLLDHRMSLEHFTGKENFLRIQRLKVRSVPDQSVLVRFLRGLGYAYQLKIEYGSNLEQNFFDVLPDYLSIDILYSYGGLLCRLTNYTLPSKLNVDYSIHAIAQDRKNQLYWSGGTCKLVEGPLPGLHSYSTLPSGLDQIIGHLEIHLETKFA